MKEFSGEEKTILMVLTTPLHSTAMRIKSCSKELPCVRCTFSMSIVSRLSDDCCGFVRRCEYRNNLRSLANTSRSTVPTCERRGSNALGARCLHSAGYKQDTLLSHVRLDSHWLLIARHWDLFEGVFWRREDDSNGANHASSFHGNEKKEC